MAVFVVQNPAFGTEAFTTINRGNMGQGSDSFFLSIAMAGAKAVLDAAHGIPASTVITPMARNGTEFGLRVSGTGDRWFTAPLDTTLDMYEITLAEHETFRIPALDFRGTPLGIDVRRVVETGIAPVIDTGIAHREAGVGQIGAGLTQAPLECFVAAVEALAASA